MQTIGIFAGRGDVVLAMLLASIIGGYLGYKIRGIIEWFKKRNLTQGEIK